MICNKRALGLLFLVAAVCSVVESVELQLHLLNLDHHPLARCNDGTPSGFYIAPNTASTTWIIHQQGGDWCYDKTSCLNRPSKLKSSLNWEHQMSLSDGVFNSSDSALMTANKVYVPYCTSDAYIGNASQTDYGFQFRGRAVVDAIFAVLISDHGLGSNPGTQVLYSGCSAGARGVLFNVDHVAATFINRNTNITRFGALLDSAFWVDIAPISPTIFSLSKQTAAIFDLANVASTADPTCVAQYPAGQQWKCIYGQYALGFVRSSYILHSYLYDEFQLSNDLGIPYGVHPKTGAQLSYAESFRSLTSQSAAAAVRTQHAFLPACFTHCATEDSRWWAVNVHGISLDAAVSSWFAQGSAVPRYVEDACAGFNCGSGCPP